MRNGREEAGKEDSSDQVGKRRLKLLSEIARNKSVSFSKLAKKFGISEETVRSDIDLLESLSIPLKQKNSNVTFVRGRPARAEVYARCLNIVGALLQNRTISIDYLEGRFQIPRDAIQRDIKQLESLGIQIELVGKNLVLPSVGVESLWENTGVGGRLNDRISISRKACLAECVVDYLRDLGDSVRSALIGTGVSAYKVAEVIYSRETELYIEAIYSSSVLVLFAFTHSKPKRITIRLAGGHLDRTTAWLEGAPGIEQLRGQSVGAIVTSFMHLSKEGFTTQQPYEVDEKLMNLKPHPDCLYILIPLEFSKLAHKNGTLVAPRGGTGEDAFDFSNPDRKYVIFTDVPDKSELDKHKTRQRLAVLEHWKEKRGIEVVSVPRPKETSSEVHG